MFQPRNPEISPRQATLAHPIPHAWTPFIRSCATSSGTKPGGILLCVHELTFAPFRACNGGGNFAELWITSYHSVWGDFAELWITCYHSVWGKFTGLWITHYCSVWGPVGESCIEAMIVFVGFKRRRKGRME